MGACSCTPVLMSSSRSRAPRSAARAASSRRRASMVFPFSNSARGKKNGSDTSSSGSTRLPAPSRSAAGGLRASTPVDSGAARRLLPRLDADGAPDKPGPNAAASAAACCCAEAGGDADLDERLCSPPSVAASGGWSSSRWSRFRIALTAAASAMMDLGRMRGLRDDSSLSCSDALATT